MTTDRPRRRILIPIDLHGIHRDTLETLVRIARQLDRELLGLLLEDMRLTRVAELPFTTEITLSGGRERSLLRDHLSQRHDQVVADARRLLNELADRDQVELSFEYATGHRLHSALEKSDELDIFFPARQRWHVITTYRDENEAPIKRLGILLDHSEQDEHVLTTAHALIRARLVRDVYVISHRPPDKDQLGPLYQEQVTRICVQSNLDRNPATITRLIRHSPYDLLLLPHNSLRNIPASELDAALEKSGGQVLVIN